jgi:hypothetical protein
LIRCDIIQDLRKLYVEVRDESIKEQALALIELEGGVKYRKKYAGVWKGVQRTRPMINQRAIKRRRINPA